MGTCAGGVRFSNSNRIIHSDYRILLLLKMHIPTIKTSWSFISAHQRHFFYIFFFNVYSVLYTLVAFMSFFMHGEY